MSFVTKDMGGVLTLRTLPTLEEYRYNGFNFIVPFEGDVAKLRDLIHNAGASVIAYTGNRYAWYEDETRIIGYFLEDESKFGNWDEVNAVKALYDAMKTETNKPVGSIFYMPWDAGSEERLRNLCNYLDFAMIDMYPYRDNRPLSIVNSEIQRTINFANTIVSPTIIIGQAMDDDMQTPPMADPGEVGVRNQYEQYRGAGLPICWYSWTNTVTDIRRNYQNLMRELYTKKYKLTFTVNDPKGNPIQSVKVVVT